MTRLPRAVAVKDGRFLRPPEGLVLDGREHGGRLVCVAIDGCCMMPVFGINREKYPIDEYGVADCKMKANTALLASVCVLNRQRSSSSHSRVAKKLSHMALS